MKDNPDLEITLRAEIAYLRGKCEVYERLLVKAGLVEEIK